MTEEQFKRANEIYNQLNELNEVKQGITNTRRCRLYYAYKHCSSDIRCPECSMRPIRNLLDKHDKMIREEIDEEIRKLQEEIKTL